MKTKIVAAIVDTRQLTLYREDGTTILIQQGDERLRPILEAVTPQIIKQGWAEIELEQGGSTGQAFRDFEKQSGLVRFFKVAKTKIAHLFASEPVAKGAVGKVPAQPVPQPASVEATAITAPPAVTDKVQAAVAEILANAQPVTDPGFTMDGVHEPGRIEVNGTTDKQRDEIDDSTHTIVAQVGDKIIPGMERIENQFARASKLGSPKGAELFLQRLASVINQRSHSVTDLLKFMERGDMPIADDGSIVIYKVLQRRGDHYVDCHSHTVPQKVGSYVCMDISLVDRNRNAECSNGLHVARRGYIREFSGDVCTIAKLAPEDVVTVPTYDANKMRVMGYHILHEMTEAQHKLVRDNMPISNDDAGAKVLANILVGNHIDRIEEVRIIRHGQVQVTSLLTGKQVSAEINDEKPESPELDQMRAEEPAVAVPEPQDLKTETLDIEDKQRKLRKSSSTGAKPVDPKAVAKKVVKLTHKEEAQKLFKAYQKKPSKKTAQALLDYKKSVKKGWAVLGLSDSWRDESTER